MAAFRITGDREVIVRGAKASPVTSLQDLGLVADAPRDEQEDHPNENDSLPS